MILSYQPFGLVDPALDGAVGGQHAGELALGIGVGHGAGKLGGVAVFQFLDGIDAGGLQQAGIVRADALDPHPVGGVGPAQDALFVETGFLGQALSLLRPLRGIEQAGRGSDADRLEPLGNVRPDARNFADGIGHLLESHQTNWPRPGIDPTISPTVSSPAFSRA